MYKEVEVDIDLSDFETEDLLDELEAVVPYLLTAVMMPKTC